MSRFDNDPDCVDCYDIAHDELDEREACSKHDDVSRETEMPPLDVPATARTHVNMVRERRVIT